MLILVLGGAGSGKSEFAETCITETECTSRIYLATMMLRDAEDAMRAQRHKKMRFGKGFETMEAPVNIEEIILPVHCAVLLEDLSNLTANEFFGANRHMQAADHILQGIFTLNDAADLCVIVSNTLFHDGIPYDTETSAYLACLARIHEALSSKADYVYEVVCNIPIPIKGAK